MQCTWDDGQGAEAIVAVLVGSDGGCRASVVKAKV